MTWTCRYYYVYARDHEGDVDESAGTWSIDGNTLVWTENGKRGQGFDIKGPGQLQTNWSTFGPTFTLNFTKGEI